MRRALPWIIAMLAAFAVVGLLVHSARLQGRAEARALAREAVLQSRVDSVRQALDAGARREAAAVRRLADLERDRGVLLQTLTTAQTLAARARARADSLIAQFAAATGDTAAGAALAEAVTAIGVEGPACLAVLQNCETRVQEQAARALDLGQQLTGARALLDTLAAVNRDLARQARPSLLRDLWRSRSATIPALLACSAIAAFR